MVEAKPKERFLKQKPSRHSQYSRSSADSSSELLTADLSLQERAEDEEVTHQEFSEQPELLTEDDLSLEDEADLPEKHSAAKYFIATNK